jgi:hypothetical protein
LPKIIAGSLVWDYDEIVWGVQPCAHCYAKRLVEVLVDGQPACIPCGDLILERLCAVAMMPDSAPPLPPRWEEW